MSNKVTTEVFDSNYSVSSRFSLISGYSKSERYPCQNIRKIVLAVFTVSLVSTSLIGCTRSPSDSSEHNASSATDTTVASHPNIGSVATITVTKPASQPASTPPAIPNHITLYTSIDKAALTPLLTDFQKQRGMTINVVNDEPMSILARLKAEGIHSPADMILTEDVGVFHQAVEAGLLQPFSSDAAIANVPTRYHDPEGNWLAMSSYVRTTVYDSRLMADKDISSFGDLAKPKWLQKLCVSQASFTPNQSLVVNLISNLGDKKATETLTGWVANLAIPPAVDDAAIMQAIENGQCQVGFVNSHTYANYLQKHPQTPIKLAWVNQGYGGVSTNITAAAIPKTAKNPQLALGLIEWLSTKDHQTLYASLSHTYPINKDAQTSVLLKSWDDFEASPISVTQYGEKRKVALDTMQEAGWK